MLLLRPGPPKYTVLLPFPHTQTQTQTQNSYSPAQLLSIRMKRIAELEKGSD